MRSSSEKSKDELPPSSTNWKSLGLLGTLVMLTLRERRLRLRKRGKLSGRPDTPSVKVTVWGL